MDLAPTSIDVAYADDSARQRLDLWLPGGAGADTSVPLVLFVHGGGWQEGSRTMAAPKVGALLAAGFAVASLDYRLSGEAPFPAAVDDVRAAVRYLQAAEAHRGVDPERIALWGESAGANIALVVGALSGRPAPWAPTGPVTPRLAAVVDWFGPTDFLTMDDDAALIDCAPSSHLADDSPESRYVGSPLRSAPDLAAQAGPLTHLAAGSTTGSDDEGTVPLPAFAVAHGTGDCTVAPRQSEMLIAALQARGVEPWVTWLDGAQHADARFDTELLAPTIDWLATTLAR